MPEPVLKNELFSCCHLGESVRDEHDIKSFSVKDPTGNGLVNYLQYYAFSDEDEGNMRSYVIRDIRSDELAGYFSLKAGLISLNEVVTEEGIIFDTLPGVEMADFAVNYRYLQRHPNLRGLGKVIFTDFVHPIIEDAARRIGVRLIYIFALPVEKLIERYGEYGFARLDEQSEEELHKRLKPQYDEDCIFMYQLL